MDAVYDLDLKASLLSAIPPLRAVAQELIECAGSALRCAIYGRGERIYDETEPCQNLYALHRGRVRTLRITPQGKDVTLYLVEPGQLFGVDAIANGASSGHCWGHDAEAMDQDTVVVSLPPLSFSAVAAKHPELMAHAMRSLWTQSQDLMDQAETRAFHDVRGRVAHALLMLAFKEGAPSERGLLISPGMTHEELAALAGTRRESVTTVLGAWKRENILTIDDSDRAIVILDLERLAEYREGGTAARAVVEQMLARMTEMERTQLREVRLAAVESFRERKRLSYQVYTRR